MAKMDDPPPWDALVESSRTLAGSRAGTLALPTPLGPCALLRQARSVAPSPTSPPPPPAETRTVRSRRNHASKLKLQADVGGGERVQSFRACRGKYDARYVKHSPELVHQSSALESTSTSMGTGWAGGHAARCADEVAVRRRRISPRPRAQALLTGPPGLAWCKVRVRNLALWATDWARPWVRVRRARARREEGGTGRGAAAGLQDSYSDD
ncbi:hypothetical protein C8T65DRAFT_267380 [Cerioporus squamosus]|nr:hypothetical protein C8T65DRAFT_267380 [Cerioporus squamosus]